MSVLTSDPAREFVLDVGPEGVSLQPAPAGAQTDAQLRLPAEAFIRLVYGRLDPDHTPPGVDISGPVDLDDLRAVFPGF